MSIFLSLLFTIQLLLQMSLKLIPNLSGCFSVSSHSVVLLFTTRRSLQQSFYIQTTWIFHVWSHSQIFRKNTRRWSLTFSYNFDNDVAYVLVYNSLNMVGMIVFVVRYLVCFPVLFLLFIDSSTTKQQTVICFTVQISWLFGLTISSIQCYSWEGEVGGGGTG